MESKNVRSRLEEIKSEVKDKLARPTLVDELTKQNEQQNEKKMGWVIREIKDDPGGFFLLVISALFTSMLGLYLGLTPHLTPDTAHPGQQLIEFNTDFGHVATAILYMLAFLTVTEFAVFYSRHKFHTREEGNGHQLWTMWAAMALGVLGIVVTGGAGGTVVASTLGFLSEFKSIPASQQKYLVWIIPALFGFYFVLHTIYRLSAQKAKAERIAQQTRERQELEHRMIMDQLELDGEEEIMLEEIERYKDLIRRGKISRGQARAAIRAGKSIPELEKELGQDLDDDGGVGTIRTPLTVDNFRPAPKTREYSVDGWLKFADMTRAEAFSMFQMIDFETASKAWNRCYSDYGMIPPGMTFSNFKEIYHKIITEDFPGKERFQYGPAGDPKRVPASRASGQDPWDEVNRRLEEVKQDLLQAKDSLENRTNGQNFH